MIWLGGATSFSASKSPAATSESWKLRPGTGQARRQPGGVARGEKA